MRQWLLSHLRWRRRSSSAHAGRSRLWPPGTAARDSGASGRPVVVPPEDSGLPPADPAAWGEVGRHRRAIPPGAVLPLQAALPTGAPRPPQPPVGGTAAEPPRGGYAPVAAGYAGGPGGVPGPRAPEGAPGPARPGPSRRSAPGGGRARIRRKHAAPGPIGSPVQAEPRSRHPAGDAGARRHGQRPGGQVQDQARPGAGRTRAEAAAATPWYELAGGWQRADGSTHCGSLEPLVRRQWQSAQAPAAALRAVERLAGLPQKIKDMLAAAVDAIYIGRGRGARARRHGPACAASRCRPAGRPGMPAREPTATGR